MKKLSIIGILSFSLLAGVTTTSCEDMLTVDTGDKSYTNANDTLYSYWGIMRCVQDVAERQIILGEIRGDLVSSTEFVTDTLYAISNFDNPADGSCSMLDIRDYYNIINNCNLYIHNADTSQVKNNVKYMLPEYAQVQAIRAWTYLQLVQNYGEVPFISEPISSLDVINNFDYNSNLVNKDNLVDKFLELGLENYISTKYPSYGQYNNGFTNISSRLLFIPVRLVLADLYLLRGQDETDFRKAAQYYYDYLKNTASVVPQAYATAAKSSSAASKDGYSYSSAALNNEAKWGQWASTYQYIASQEVISTIPGNANKGFGTMLTRVADIFGYTPTSSQNSEVTENEDGSEEAATSGAISVKRTYKRQFTPSESYTGLNEEQTYIDYDIERERREDFTCGDARIKISTEDVTYEGEAYKLCAKAAKGSTFYYTVPIYRTTVVWLRLAEAINRAGYPQHAFAILKDGLSRSNMPSLQDVRHINVRLDENGETVKDENGKVIRDTTYVREMVYNTAGAMYYVDSLEHKSFFLNFSDDVWNNNYGIHARGCGFGKWTNIEGQGVRTNLTGKNDTTSFAYDVLLAAQGVDPTTASKADTINAIENIIVDELALEAQFEGYRFTDLVRFANHKNNAGFNGTEWLANKVASRDVRKSKEDENVILGSRNEEIYSKLQDKTNWYLTKPVWDVK